jgi:hypothetical protein
MTCGLWQLNLEEVHQTSKKRYDLQVIFAKILNDPRLSNKILVTPKKKLNLSFSLCVCVLEDPTQSQDVTSLRNFEFYKMFKI